MKTNQIFNFLIIYLISTIKSAAMSTEDTGNPNNNYEEANTEIVSNEIENKINEIISDITSYVSDTNIYIENNSIYQVYYYSDSSNIEEVANENTLSKLTFDDNEISLVKQANNIDENEDIIIIKVDAVVGDYPIPSVQFFLCDENGNYLDSSSLSNIIVEKPILNPDYLNLERASYLNNKLINMFNTSEPFYNDICFKFSSEKNGEDVTLKDRRKDYYINITFCESNCNYSHFDYVNIKVVCNCEPIQEINDMELLSFNELKNAFVAHLINFNYKIIKCYKLVFNINNYDNAGTIIIFVCIVISVICSIFYVKYHNMQPVKDSLEKLQPKKINDEKVDTLSKMKNNESIDEIDLENNDNNLTLNNNNFNNKKFKMNGNNDKKKEENKIEKNNTELSKAIEKDKKELTEEEILKKKDKIEALHYDLTQLSFEEAIILDKRTFKQIYWDYLLQSQIILSHFYADLILELRYIKIILLVINCSIQFFFNCFFYTDEYISDVYHRNGVISFFSDLPKVIYSILISFIINTILKFLSYYKDDLIKIVFEENDLEMYWEKSKKILKNFYYRINIFIIIVFIFELFFWYYCTAFCAAYPNNQKLLIFSVFQDYIINLLLPFILCLFLSFLRQLSIQKKIKTLYCIVGLLDLFM